MSLVIYARFTIATYRYSLQLVDIEGWRKSITEPDDLREPLEASGVPIVGAFREYTGIIRESGANSAYKKNHCPELRVSQMKTLP